MIIVDVWGGHHNMDHLARYIVSVDEAMALARAELAAGFLVNMRLDHQWGCYTNFDKRISA